MTNTKFRKRALLSSVAMLLVAIVALGSATFAWFNTQNSATARTVTATTTKGSDITLSETGGAGASPWTHSLVFSQYTLHDTENLVPVTTQDFSTWNYVNAADYDTGYATAAYNSFLKSAIGNYPGYVKHSYLYVKSSKAQNVTITPQLTTNNNGSFVRMAFVPIAATSAATPTGHNQATAVGASKQIIWCNTGLNDRANSSWNASGQSAEPYFTATNATINTTMTTPLVLSNVTAEAIYGFEVFVWEEGTDLDCHDENAASSVVVTFNVTGDATD